MRKIIDRPRYTCMLGGALGTLKALPGKVVPIIHAAPGCGGNLGYTISLSAAYAGSGYASNQAVSSSCVTEQDLVFGGEDRLREQIQSTLEIMDGELYVVLTACMVEVIGDDARHVVAEFATADKPLLVAETGGFKGDSYEGYDMLMELLVREYVEPAPQKDAKTVNLLGVVPIMDIFWKRDLTIIKGLIEELGFEVNSFFGENETLDNLKYSARASLNIVLSDVYGIKPAEAYQSQHDIPYITTAFPIGDAGTTAFLYQVADALGVEKELVDAVVARHRAEYYHYMEKVVDLYTDCDFQRYAVVISDVNYAPALAKYLADDIGWLPDLVMITNQLSDASRELVAQRFAGFRSGIMPHVYFDTDTSHAYDYLCELWPAAPDDGAYHDSFDPAFVVGSSLDREFAQKINAEHLSISYPINNRMIVNRGYAGYEGGLNLLEDLMTQLVACR